MAALMPATMVLGPAATADPGAVTDAAAPVVDLAGPPAEALEEAPAAVVERVSAQLSTDLGSVPHALPPGDAPEQGLQIETIEVARNVSADFPKIHLMVGVRPDAKPWHPSGKALDIMIPDPGSAEGIALGNAILAYALDNAARFGIQDVIWRGTYYTPAGPSGSGYGHYDHVHITTLGGGYPTGDETYLSDAGSGAAG